MKFKINPTYIIIKTIKMLFGYILTLAIVYTVINLQDFESFVISFGIVALILYYLFILSYNVLSTPSKISTSEVLTNTSK